MLRDFQYNPTTTQLTDVLKRFSLDYNSAKSSIDLLRFEVLSPDSFVWKLLLGSVIYYLYAEDYIPSLDHVKNVINDYVGNNKWDFVAPQQVIAFESASPVKGADVYQKTERANQLMEYAVDSGYDFVCLVKTLENPDDAHFPNTVR
jgi:hypothetical protein